MLTVVVNTKPGVLDWLAPARPFWYVAERDEGRRMAVYPNDVACDAVDGASGTEFRRWLDHLFIGREGTTWRLLVLADEADAVDPVARGWFRFTDRSAEALEERVVLSFASEELPDRDCRRRFEFIDTIDEPPTFVVRTHDAMLRTNVPDAKLTTAHLIAALSQPRLFGKRTPRELYVPATWDGPHVRGIVLWGDPALGRDDAMLSEVVADYRHSLEQRRDALDQKPLTVDVGVGESPGATIGFAWTPPSGPELQRFEADLPRGWWARKLEVDSRAWCRAAGSTLENYLDRGIADANESFESVFAQEQAQRPEKRAMTLGEIDRFLRDVDSMIDEQERALASDLRSPDSDPCVDAAGRSAELTSAAMRRPGRGQVFLAGLLGFAALLPAALLQRSLVSGVVSMSVLVLLELVVTILVARSLGRRLRRAREAVVLAVTRMAEERKNYLREFRNRLEARLQRLALDRNRQEANERKRELQRRQRRRELHRDDLKTHAQWAAELSRAWPDRAAGSGASTRVRPVDIDRSVGDEPAYEPFGAVDLETWPRGRIYVAGRTDGDGDEGLRTPECSALGQLILEPCGSRATAHEG